MAIGGGAHTVRVLVAGGTRYIGRHLVEFLLDEGHDVTLFNRGRTNPDLFPDAARIPGERADPPAALPQHHWDWVFDISAFTEGDLVGLIDRVGLRTDRYVFISTRGTYIPQPEGVEITEETPQWPPEPRYLDPPAPSWYGARKAKAEAALWRLAPAIGFEASVIRPPVVYGPYDYWDQRGEYWLGRVQSGDVVVPEEPVHFTRCVYVRDCVRAMIAAAKAPRAAGRAYNVAATRHRTLREWIDTAAALLGVTPRVRRVSWQALQEAGITRVPMLRREMQGFSTERAERELGLTSTPFAQTLAECLAHPGDEMEDPLASF